MFGTPVGAVYALCPEAERVTDPNASRLPTPITETTVAGWIVDISSAVAVGIGPWGSFTGPTLESIRAAARAVVANGAASYLEAARYPTAAGLNDSNYAGMLWARYTVGVEALKAQVTELLDSGGGDVVTPETGRAVAAFPATYFGDGVFW